MKFNQFNIYRLTRRLASHSLSEHIRYWFPNFHKLLIRIRIYRHTSSSLPLLLWLLWIVTDKHFKKKGFELSNYGVWLVQRPNDATYKFCLDAQYMNNLDFQLHSLTGRVIFIDIGANIGIFSLLAEKSPSIIAIHSFEPDSSSFEFLNLNIERNCAKKIVTHNLAIGVNPGTNFLSQTKGHSGASTIVNDANKGKRDFSTITMVDHMYLNTILNSKSGEYFVKIDVEGYELEVLRTLRNADFFSSVKYIFIEIDQSNGNGEKVEEFLNHCGFIEQGRWGWDVLWMK